MELVEAVRAEMHIPLAVKIGPFFSSVGHMAHRLVAAGADGLVLFNRFMQPDIDLDTMTIDPALHLSTSAELLLPLRWIGILRDKVHASLALSTGCHTAEDALKGLLVGADVVMMASALLHEGPEHLATVHAGMTAWMDEHEYESVDAAARRDVDGARPEPGGVRARELRAAGDELRVPLRLADDRHGLPVLATRRRDRLPRHGYRHAPNRRSPRTSPASPTSSRGSSRSRPSATRATTARTCGPAPN